MLTINNFIRSVSAKETRHSHENSKKVETEYLLDVSLLIPPPPELNHQKNNFNIFPEINLPPLINNSYQTTMAGIKLF